jgi:hypothetical protein
MHQAIHLLEPSLLTPDKYYKVYSTDPSLLFVKVGGQFYDEASDDDRSASQRKSAAIACQKK